MRRQAGTGRQETERKKEIGSERTLKKRTPSKTNKNQAGNREKEEEIGRERTLKKRALSKTNESQVGL